MSEDTENIQDGYWEGLLKHEREEINAELDLKIVAKHLEYAGIYKLEPEVVLSVIKYAKNNPDWDVLGVCEAACGEWDVLH